ncbi:MAG: ParB/RepB/Spo0J family partition protein [Candidatus Omnitrophica bacterium]|nr:ParB/RepB/Spo0J family partition protein [Candidatus Omnitrophota bacterium]
MERRVLGKGLDALIPKKAVTVLPEEFAHLDIDKICPAPNQPRKEIAKLELADLARSIESKGVVQPILVRKLHSGMYEIVAGERRFQAAKLLGLKEIPSVIKELDDKNAFVMAIVENLQRKDLNSIEEAQSFERLMNEFDFSLEDISKFIGKNKSTIVNTLRLLKLPEQIKKALIDGIINRSQARTILGVEKIQEQENLFCKILKEGLSVREIEKKARGISRKKKTIDPFIIDEEDNLQKILGTKVKIFNKKNNQGKIVIEYYNLNDLERIIKRFE